MDLSMSNMLKSSVILIVYLLSVALEEGLRSGRKYQALHPSTGHFDVSVLVR